MLEVNENIVNSTKTDKESKLQVMEQDSKVDSLDQELDSMASEKESTVEKEDEWMDILGSGQLRKKVITYNYR
jgi:hypothetical protein